MRPSIHPSIDRSIQSAQGGNLDRLLAIAAAAGPWYETNETKIQPKNLPAGVGVIISFLPIPTRSQANAWAEGGTFLGWAAEECEKFCLQQTLQLGHACDRNAASDLRTGVSFFFFLFFFDDYFLGVFLGDYTLPKRVI